MIIEEVYPNELVDGYRFNDVVTINKSKPTDSEVKLGFILSKIFIGGLTNPSLDKLLDNILIEYPIARYCFKEYSNPIIESYFRLTSRELDKSTLFIDRRKGIVCLEDDRWIR